MLISANEIVVKLRNGIERLFDVGYLMECDGRSLIVQRPGYATPYTIAFRFVECVELRMVESPDAEDSP